MFKLLLNSVVKNDELVQYYVINSNLNMSPGKIAVQVAHVAVKIVLNEEILCPVLFNKWYNEYNQKKIVLKGKQKDLQKLVNLGIFYHINDLGLTEIPSGSLTCVGLGTMWKSDAQQYIKGLQLL